MLQDGENPQTQKPTKRRLACNDRLEGRLFLNPEKSTTQSFFASNSKTSSTNSIVSHLAWRQPHGSLARP